MKKVKRTVIAIGAIIAVPVLLMYGTFVCGVPLLWPYYEPEMEGAEIIDPDAWFLPRSNLAPYARFPLGNGLYVNIFSNCYPLKEHGYRACALKMRFAVPPGTEVSFAETPVLVTSPDGENLINVRFYERYAGKTQNKMRDGAVFLEYSRKTASVSLTAEAGRNYRANIPDIVINGMQVSLPEIRFARVNNLTCVGFISNF